MSDENNSRRKVIIIVALLLLALLALLLFRCSCRAVSETALPKGTNPLASGTTPGATPSGSLPEEVLTAATLSAPASVKAGAAFSVQWTGPNNPEDYVTIVPKDASEGSYQNYRQTREGNPLTLTAPMDPGLNELRYMAARARKILGRLAIKVEPVEAALQAPDEGVLGTVITVTWTGPNNAGDYVTVVPKDTPDGQYGNYVETAQGAKLNLMLPPTAGEAELRYMSGQERRVLGRRPLRILAPTITLDAPTEAIAGSLLTIHWTGPKNSGDYITILPKPKPDGQYGNYSDVAKGSPLDVLVPIEPGEAELRYMTGQGAKVLARRNLRIVPARITLDAPAEVPVNQPVSVKWTGPNHTGDYITVVPKAKPDGQYAAYANTSAGSPVKITAPKEAGDAEIRYMSGQGAKVLARRAIAVTPESK